MRRRALLAAIGLGSATTVGALSVYEPRVLREVAVRNRTEQTRVIEDRHTTEPTAEDTAETEAGGVTVRWIGPCPPAEADPDRTACDVPRWTWPFRLL